MVKDKEKGCERAERTERQRPSEEQKLKRKM